MFAVLRCLSHIRFRTRNTSSQPRPAKQHQRSAQQVQVSLSFARVAIWWLSCGVLLYLRRCCLRVSQIIRTRAKELTSDVSTAAPAAAAVDTAAAATSASTPSPSLMKRTRDDEPAASAGAVARQRQGDGTVWDWVRVHRVGAAGNCGIYRWGDVGCFGLIMTDCAILWCVFADDDV